MNELGNCDLSPINRENPKNKETIAKKSNKKLVNFDVYPNFRLSN